MAKPPLDRQGLIPMLAGAANLLHYLCPGTLGLWNSSHFVVAMGDGSVRFVPKNIDVNVLRGAITWAGNEQLPAGWAD
jgi:hypothetical protein